MKVQFRAKTQAKAQQQAQAKNRAQVVTQAQKQVQKRTRNQAQTARRFKAFKQVNSRKIEAVIFVAVLLVAIGGLYFAYSGTGQAVRQLGGCKGGYIIPYMSPGGMSSTYSQDFKFRGIEGNIMLLDIKERKAAFRVNGVDTPYLGFGQTFIGEKIGIKIGTIDSKSVGICLATTIPECVDYYWDLDTKRRECGRWMSQAEELF